MLNSTVDGGDIVGSSTSIIDVEMFDTSANLIDDGVMIRMLTASYKYCAN